MAKANLFFTESSVSTMEVEEDFRLCGLGKWLYGEERGVAETHIPEIEAPLKHVEQNHAELHGSVAEINALARANPKEAITIKAKAIYDSKSKPALIAVQQELNNVGDILRRYSEKSAADLTQKAGFTRTTVPVLAGITIMLGILISFCIIRILSSSLQKVIAHSNSLAMGDMSARSNLRQKDELGLIAISSNNLAILLDRMCTRVKGSSSTIAESTISLNSLSHILAGSAEEMAAHCSAVATAAERMNANMNAIAAASEQSSTNVGMVAAAAEEMNSTITEIASNSENARRITTTAVEESTRVLVSVHELESAAAQISKVTETINEIADQTNLLALNATIEAARAGEAGKGFAVVAHEIKELANQTTGATRQIRERIEGVQTSSNQTISGITTISAIINETRDIVESMALSVEEQAATSREIASNVSQASAGMQDVNENIAQASLVNGEVASDIARIKVEADGVAASSSDIRELADEMKYNTQALAGMLADFTFKQPKFDIGKIKMAHFNWKMKLSSVLAGYTTMESSQVPNHHQCDFVKWYDNAPAEFRDLPVFKEIGIQHRLVHQKVGEAIDSFNNNKTDIANARLAEFEKARKKLFKELDALYLN
jgi:methyl-accepting chemotaxis protein